MKIPVYKPLLAGNEKKYLAECIDSGWVSGSGPFVERFEKAFAEYMGTKYAVAVCNGTVALETMLWAYKTDTIGMTASTIISCYIAALRTKHNVVFSDISLVDSCMKESVCSNELIVHSFGNECKGKGLEDRSQFWERKPVKFAAAYSLYSNKLITAGEGGVIITNEQGASSKMRKYRDLCHSKQRFVHTNLGQNYRMSNLNAAVALAQLEQIDHLIATRQYTHKLYTEVYLPSTVRCVNRDAPIPWMTLIDCGVSAKEVQSEMSTRGIETRRFFYPLPLQKPIAYPGEFPNAIKAWEEWIYLPSYPGLINNNIQLICKALKDSIETVRRRNV